MTELKKTRESEGFAAAAATGGGDVDARLTHSTCTVEFGFSLGDDDGYGYELYFVV